MSARALTENGAGRNIRSPGLLDREGHRLCVDVEAKAPVTIDHRRRGRLPHDGPLRARHDVAGLHAIDVGRDGDHTVRIVAGKIGVHATDGDRVCLFTSGAGSLQQGGADAGETLSLNDRHGSSSVLESLYEREHLMSLLARSIVEAWTMASISPPLPIPGRW